MKINEILSENTQKSGPISQRFQRATVGLNKFRDNDMADRYYELYRVMLAAASVNGKDPIDVDPESWIGRYNIATPYTAEEQAMLKQAFQAIGSEWHDLNNGDYRSQEVTSTYKASPIAKPRRNQFGI
jgi:hypothetical protein